MLRFFIRGKAMAKGLDHAKAKGNIGGGRMHSAAKCIQPRQYASRPGISLALPYCLLPIAYCLLPIAYCVLPIAYCLLPIAYWPIANSEVLNICIVSLSNVELLRPLRTMI